MKLLDVRASNFGVFQQRRFDFAGDGFVVVHGPNEAGKSTLLQLLRELLFGFPHSSSYAIEGKPMAVEAEALLQDGRTLTFRRRKGRGITVEGFVDPGAIAVDDAKLMQLLGHASESLYRNLFAFSLTELADGAASFKQAGLTLTEALFGGALGGLSSLPRVKTALRREHEELFLPRAQKPPINRLVRQIQAEKSKLKQVLLKPARYQELETQLAEIQAEITEREAKRRAAAEELAHLQRLEKAWQPWCERRAAEQQLAALSIPEGLKSGDVERFEELLKSAAQLAGELDEFSAQIERLQRRRAQTVFDPQYLERRAAIKALEQDLGKIEGYLRDLPLRQADLAKAEANIAFVLRGIDPAWTVEKLQSLRLSLDQRTRVRTLAERYQKLELQRERSESDLAALATSIARQEQQLAALGEDLGVEALSSALAGQADYHAAKKELRRDEQQAEQLAKSLAQTCQRLCKVAAINDDVTLAALEPPLIATIEEYRDSLAALESQRTAAQQRATQAAAALQEVEDRLLGLEASGAVPDRSVLDAARRKRDEGWKLIRRHYVEGQDCEKRIVTWLDDPLGSLPEQFHQSIERADRMADERLLMADAVAKKEEALHQRQLAAARLEKAQAELAAIEQQLANEAQAWRMLWPPAITPASPGAMLEWSRLLDAWRQQSRELESLATAQQRSREIIAAFERTLRDACSDQTAPIDRLLRTAAQRVDLAREQQGERRALSNKLAESQQDLAENQRKANKLAADADAWQREWQELLAQLGLPLDWQIAAIVKLLSDIEQILLDQNAAAGYRTRIGDMQAELSDFESNSSALANELDPALVPLPAIQRVRELAQHCDAAAAAQLELTNLAKQTEEKHAELTRRTERRTAALVEREAILRRAGAASDDAFRAIAQDVQRRRELIAELNSANRTLLVAREHEDEAAFAAALAALDLGRLHQQQAQLKATIDDLTAHLDKLRVSTGELSHELTQMQQEGDALAVQQTLESYRGQLREHVERWASLVLAEKMLDRAVEQFQRQHQENVLAEAKRLFRRMTGGKHPDIRHSVGDVISIIDQQGCERTPDQLSRGTQEQLYLAFRLAYIRNYCRDREPLPLVMDDVLVNFDETRASDTIEALLELSQDVQIIFLTCHAKTVEMVRQHAPLCTLIDMGAGVAEAV